MEGTTDFLFDAFSGGVTDKATVVAAHVGGNGLVETVTSNTHRFGIYDSVKGDDGNLGGTTTNIDHHGAARLLYRQTGADGGCHGFLNKTHFARTGTNDRFANGTAFHLRGFARHANQDPGTRTYKGILMHLVDEVLQHFFCHLEISYDTVLQGTDCSDVAGCTAQHALGVGADGGNGLLAVVNADGNN